MLYYFTYMHNGMLRRHTALTEKEALAFFALLVAIKVDSIRVLTATKR